MSESFKYDVFLSHSAKDKTVMRELAGLLKDDGLRVWFEDWEIKPKTRKSHREEAIKRGLESARVLVLAMSREAFKSEWAILESRSLRFRDPTNKELRFVPLRLDEAKIPIELRQFAYVDWRKDADKGYAKLKAACIRELPGRFRTPQFENQLKVQAIVTKKLKISSEFLDMSPQVLEWSPRGNLLACLFGDPEGEWRAGMLIWDTKTKSLKHSFWFQGGKSAHDFRWTQDDNLLLVAYEIKKEYKGNLQLYDIRSQNFVGEPFFKHGSKVSVNSLAYSKNHDQFASAVTDYDNDRAFIRIWFTDSLKTKAEITLPFTENVDGMCWSTSGQFLAYGVRFLGTPDRYDIQIIDLQSETIAHNLSGHRDHIHTCVWHPSGEFLASCSNDKTIKVWDPQHGSLVCTLEGHKDLVFGLSFSPDGSLMSSSSGDGTIRIWDCTRWSLVRTLQVFPPDFRSSTIPFHPRHNTFASTYSEPGEIHLVTVKSIPPTSLSGLGEGYQRYTNAKVLLVGESGVGKTGLAYRLTEDRFKESVSSDAAWATQLKLPHEPGGEEEREIWLWDFAGQADYRLIHQLYMDETALAVLVFNPQSESPFEGLSQWDRDLQRAARRPFQKLLVAGRIDRGGLMLSRDSVEDFKKKRGFADYIETSALDGTNCDTLRDAIVSHITWDEIPWTASPSIFRLLKDEIVKLKDKGKVLLRMVELKQQLEMHLPTEDFTIEQLRAVVGLLAGPGVVWQLEFGDFVVLRPEWINIYAGALIRSVRAHIGEIGVILEQDVLTGNLNYTLHHRSKEEDEESTLDDSQSRSRGSEIRRLPPADEAVVLRAMHQTFVDHGLCLREHTEAGTQLVFPSYFRRELPKDPGHPSVLVSYTFNGNANDIYATLVVQLHHTKAFVSDQLWRYAADFRTHSDKRIGLTMTKAPDGAADISVYFEPRIPEDTQVTFIKYVHEHLLAKAHDVKRLRHYICDYCSTPVENRQTALNRLQSGKTDILCVNCERRIPLWDLVEQKFASPEFRKRVRELEELASASIDNESKDLILRGHAYVVAGEAGQIYREYAGSDHGIDGEIEFKDHKGKPSGDRLYLQLKSGDSYLRKRKKDGAEVFTIKNERLARYWQQQAYPVMLVIRTTDGQIRWMNVTDYLTQHAKGTRQVVFNGGPFTALSVSQLRDRVIANLND